MTEPSTTPPRSSEAEVNLDDIDGYVTQHVERREPDPEVIHLDGQVVFAHALDDGAETFRILGEGALGDLEVQAAFRQVVFALQLDEMFHEAWLEQLVTRDVDRDGHRLAVRHPMPAASALAGLLPHEQVEVVHLAAILKSGDELRRFNPSELGMIPAREGLGADNLA